ncbi:MAG: hypothetical protein HY934_05470 [Candidatus Firestonebacteria bacterium]|nr:hypothetical protein [Candidatus Firestonebacteria bacterium]
MNINLLKIIILFLVFLSINISAKNDNDNNEELNNFYNKYKNTPCPSWLKRISEDKYIVVLNQKIDEKEKPKVLKFEYYIRKAGENVTQDSYENAALYNLYIMFFEEGQRYLREYFLTMKQIESQAFLSLVDDPEKRHDNIVSKGQMIETLLRAVFEKGNYFYYQCWQMGSVMSIEKFLMHANSFKKEIDKISIYLVKMVDPSDIRNYVLAIKGGDRQLVGFRMRFYDRLESLAQLAIRDVAYSQKDNTTYYKDYDKNSITVSYNELKTKLETLMSDPLFAELNEEEKEALSYIAKTEIKEINKFFNNLGDDINNKLNPVQNTDSTKLPVPDINK